MSLSYIHLFIYERFFLLAARYQPPIAVHALVLTS